MKSILLLAILGLFTTACTQNEPYVSHQSQTELKQPKIEYKTVCEVKIVKDLKEVQEQVTNTKTELNLAQSLWDGDIKTSIIPHISTVTTYYVVYTDKSHEEVNRNIWLNLSKGDTIKKYKQFKI